MALLGTPQNEHDELRDFAGLWQSRPGLAGLMTVFLLSLGGFPPTAGFIGKWYIFSAAVAAGLLLARDHRRADERRLGLLLPADRRHDVHDGRDRRGAPARAAARDRRPGASADARGVLPRHPADAHPRPRARLDPTIF